MRVALDASRMRVLGIAGASDTGKTTTVERLVPALGGRVATVKSIHHDVTPDQPGKDTYRHREAGADRVVGVTPRVGFEVGDGGKEAAVARTGHEVDALRSTLERLERLERPAFTLVEGFSESLLPKVVTDDRAVEGRVVGRRDDALDTLSETAESLAPYPTVDGVRRTLAAREADRDSDGTSGGPVVGAGAFSTPDPVARSADEWVSRDALPADWDADGPTDGDATFHSEAFEDAGFRVVGDAAVAVKPPLRIPEPAVVVVGVTADDAEAATAAVVDAGRELARRWPPLSTVSDRVVVG